MGRVERWRFALTVNVKNECVWHSTNFDYIISIIKPEIQG